MTNQRIAITSETGRKFGVTYAEPYHHIGKTPSKVDEYVRKNAVKV